MKTASLAVIVGLVFALMTACDTAPDTVEGKETLEDKAAATIATFKKTDSGLNQKFFQPAKGYAVFPSIGKGAVGVGGAYGKGVLYEGGAPVGYCSLSQGSVGFQLGGQTYSEIIFFETAESLSEFKNGDMEFAAQASAVAAAADASSNADYDNGVAVFTLAAKGLMYEASIGGQKFSYEPK